MADQTYNTIEYRPAAPGTAGNELALASWGKGLVRVRAEFVSQEMDTLSFQEAGALVDGPNLFDWVPAGGVKIGSTVILRMGRTQAEDGSFSGGRRVFFGILTATAREASDAREAGSYKFAGPWWYLVNKTYKMQYTVWDGYVTPGNPSSGNKFVTKYGSHIWLNRDLHNNWLCTGEQIQDAVQYAITQGAPMQLLPNVSVDINPGVPGFERTAQISSGIQTFSDVPVDEVCDLTCAEIIKKQVRWTPDCVVWFDHSTEPYPTFRCARRQFLS